jgi:malonyl-CoA O-methyltransferase
VSALAARDAYRLWAQTYGDENVFSWIENRLAAAMTPPLAGLRLLDAGCGTGRRLRGTAASRAVGIDLSPEMLAVGDGDGSAELLLGDIRALPLADRSFDVVWCRLAIGHVPDCRPVYAELGRVADAGARVIVTDFHPEAYEAGQRRTFRDSAGVLREVEHHVHAAPAQAAAAAAAGLTLLEARQGKVGPEVRPLYEEAGRGSLYEDHVGFAVVLAMSFKRDL